MTNRGNTGYLTEQLMTLYTENIQAQVETYVPARYGKTGFPTVSTTTHNIEYMLMLSISSLRPCLN